MTGMQDDVRLPFSVMDPVLGDLFAVLWEPETILQTGSALKILTSEVLTQVGQQVLQATLLTAMMSALQWPMSEPLPLCDHRIAADILIVLTKLAYLIDNPWSNALDRARSAGAILADILNNRSLGVRPISLIGFSLGARVIFYALVELARMKAYGIVQDVVLLGATVTASKKQWQEVRGVVSGRFVNGFSRSDWILGYLFRATTGGLSTVAGLRPVEHIPDLENYDLTEIVQGHMAYRSSMPLILKHLGFRTTSDTFDEPEEDDADRPDREVLTREEEERRAAEKEKKASRWWNKRKKAAAAKKTSRNDTFTEEKKDYDYDLGSETSSARASISSELPTPSSSTADLTVFNPDKIREALSEIEEQPLPPSASVPHLPMQRVNSPSADTSASTQPLPRPASSGGSIIASTTPQVNLPSPADDWATATPSNPSSSWGKPSDPSSFFDTPGMHPFGQMDNLNSSTLSFGGVNGELNDDDSSSPSWSSQPTQLKPSVSASNPWS